MFIDEAREWANRRYPCDGQAQRYLLMGAQFGYNKAMKEWRDCFMSCSSPYCADKFRDIQCNGMLGNITKEVAPSQGRELKQKKS